jgi:hypothetical protein
MLEHPLPSGVYRHYSGDHYLVIGVARDAACDADERLLVIYTRLYSRDGVPLNARPLVEFCQMVETEAGPVQRFTPIGYADSADREVPVIQEAK